jgi:hypothetical protein
MDPYDTACTLPDLPLSCYRIRISRDKRAVFVSSFSYHHEEEQTLLAVHDEHEGSFWFPVGVSHVAQFTGNHHSLLCNSNAMRTQPRTRLDEQGGS